MDDNRLFFANGNGKDEKAVPIISVSSGKGGVGKTVLVANLARLLSWSGSKVLIIDLDLRNRGATSLLADLTTKDHATVADLLDAVGTSPASDLVNWLERTTLAQAPDPANTLYLLPSARDRQSVLGLEFRREVSLLREFLRVLVAELIKRHEFQCVLFDCGAGPEPLFLAAAGLSTDVILITEADMVTWAGNVNLFNHLYEYYRNDADTLLNVQFVLNRVPSKYDLAELKQVYERRLSRYLKGRRILATIPFDYTIFQSFTQDTFFVDALPASIFVQHVATIADELFTTTHPELLTTQARSLSASASRPRLTSLFKKRPTWTNPFSAHRGI